MAEFFGFITGIVVLSLLFKPFFGDASGFWKCIGFWLTPDIFSLFQGKWGEDWWAETKLGIWLLCGGMTGFATYTGIIRLLS